MKRGLLSKDQPALTRLAPNEIVSDALLHIFEVY